MSTDTAVPVAAILAWCDHVEHRGNQAETPPGGPAFRAYYEGMRDGVKECIAQVRQAVLHDFDIQALDGKPLT